MGSKQGKPILNCLLAALAVTLAALLAALIVNRSGEKALEKAIKLNTTGYPSVQVCGDNVYYIDGHSLYCVSTEGKRLWNRTVGDGSTFTATPHGVAVCYGGTVTLLNVDTGVPEGTVQGSYNALSAIVGDVYAACVFGPEDNATVVMTDIHGNEVDRIDNLSELTVLDCGFFEGRSLLWLETLDASGSVPTCRISTYKPGKRETGTINEMDQVIYKVMFRSSYICGVGTTYMKLYDYTGNELTDKRKTVYGWVLEAVAESETDPLMVFVPSSQSGAEDKRRDLLLIRGETEQKLHLPAACSCVAANGNTVYGFAGSVLAVGSFGLSGTTLYSLPVSVDGVVGITNDGTAVVRGGSSVYLIKLP